MTGPAPAAVLLSLLFLLGWAAYSFRDFSRSRLEEICRRKRLEFRFSAILQMYEPALLAVELLQQLLRWLYVLAIVIPIDWIAFAADDAPWSLRLLVLGRMLAAWALLWAVAGLGAWIAARVAGEWFLAATWPFWSAWMTLCAPLLWIVRFFDRLIHRIVGLNPPESEDAAANLTEEIRTVVDEGQREGAIVSEAQTMIHRVIEFHEVDVADVMTPRTSMDCIPADADLDTMRRMFIEQGHSRMPVVGKTTDDVIGMLHSKDLLNHLQPRPGPVAIEEIVREPMYVPETMGLDTLLRKFKRERVHLAIVIDEYGGVAGLVTMEDILEEIVGEIGDEYDATEAAPIHEVSPGVADIDARVHIDDVNDQLGVQLPSDRDYDTLGGFVFSLLGRIPVGGEQFTWERLKFTVLEADKRRVIRVRLVQETPESAQVEHESTA